MHRFLLLGVAFAAMLSVDCPSADAQAAVDLGRIWNEQEAGWQGYGHVSGGPTRFRPSGPRTIVSSVPICRWPSAEISFPSHDVHMGPAWARPLRIHGNCEGQYHRRRLQLQLVESRRKVDGTLFRADLSCARRMGGALRLSCEANVRFPRSGLFDQSAGRNLQRRDFALSVHLIRAAGCSSLRQVSAPSRPLSPMKPITPSSAVGRSPRLRRLEPRLLFCRHRQRKGAVAPDDGRAVLARWRTLLREQEDSSGLLRLRRRRRGCQLREHRRRLGLHRHRRRQVTAFKSNPDFAINLDRGLQRWKLAAAAQALDKAGEMRAQQGPAAAGGDTGPPPPGHRRQARECRAAAPGTAPARPARSY